MNAGLASCPASSVSQGQHGAGRETDHADAVRIDLPLGGAAPDQGEGGARVLELRREASRHLLRIRRRSRARARGAREHLLHRAFESGHVRRGLVQAVLENECRHAALGQRASDIPAFVLHRQGSKTAARSHDDGGAAGLGRVGQERRDRRHRDVASELAAVLGVPRFSSLRVGERRRCQSRSHSADRGWRSASSCRSPAQRPAPRMSRPRPEWPPRTRSDVRK